MSSFFNRIHRKGDPSARRGAANKGIAREAKNVKRRGALERRKKDVVIYGRILADKDAPEGERLEATQKREIALYEIDRLKDKLGNLLFSDVC